MNTDTKKQKLETHEPDGTSSKAPFPAQILYVMGLIGLVSGLFIAVLLIVGSSDFTAAMERLGFQNISPATVGLFIGVASTAGFWLINSIRGGKRWALSIYSVITVFGFASTLYGWTTTTGQTAGLFETFFPYIVLGFLLVPLWTKYRGYFN